MKIPELEKDSRIHMIGIGGVGVGPLAQVLSGMGFTVTGSDLKAGPVTARLSSMGVRVHIGHHPSNVGDARVVVATAAASEDNPEVVEARRLGIPVVSRAAMLGWLMNSRRGVAVSGTHGKTTTTAMLATLTADSGKDPTILLGGDLECLNGSCRLGRGDLLIAEACEAYGSFLELHPSLAIITNIDADHLDYYVSIDRVVQAFRDFLRGMPADGCAVLCTDCSRVREVMDAAPSRVVTYGVSSVADFRADCIIHIGMDTEFRVTERGTDMGVFRLRIPGRHNVQNALGAIAAAIELGVTVEHVREHLDRFRGAGRRFEILGEAGGVMVVDDYAHHPTEVAATIAAARSSGRRILAAFQPHLYSRTLEFADQFAARLASADRVFVTEIYAARESPMAGVSGRLIVDAICRKSPGKAVFLPDKNLLPDRIMHEIDHGDLVLVMGAGDIRTAAEEIMDRLEQRQR